MVAFGLHYVWESVQCSALYEHGSFKATRWGMVMATLGDVVITWILYIFVAALSRRWRWTLSFWTWRQWLPLIAVALMIGVGIELHALATGRWGYLPRTPVVPLLGVSLVALLQLAILTPTTFLISDRALWQTPKR